MTWNEAFSGEPEPERRLMQGAPTPTRGLNYVGSHLFQMDEKGRVALPAAFRRGVPKEEEQRFVLIPGPAPSLALYPESTWQEVTGRLEELRQHNPKARMWVLKQLAAAVDVTPDSQGRIVIPAKLKDVAGLEGQVLLIGALDKIEIWDPKRFEAAASEVTEEFEEFAPQIFR